MLPFVSICVYSLIMAVSSFLAGMLPLLFNLPPEKMDYVSTYSMGVLVSAAQVLIIPEGIKNSPEGSSIGVWLLAGFITLFTIDRLSSILNSGSHTALPAGRSTDDLDNFNIDLDDEELVVGDTNGAENGVIMSPKALLHSLFKGNWQDMKGPLKEGLISAFKTTDTLGLLIHCLTDGIALTSSLMASAESPSVQSVFVVVAIFLHKLPTAFALVAILLQGGLPRIYCLCHLFAFSVAAPLGAFLTYFVIVLFVSQNLEGLSGLLLLFSGGSFLYVGFHALQKMMADELVPPSENTPRKSRRSKLIEYATCVAGMLTPVLVAGIQE